MRKEGGGVLLVAAVATGIRLPAMSAAASFNVTERVVMFLPG
jgi:hypothetical protein